MKYVQHPETGKLIPGDKVDWPRYHTVADHSNFIVRGDIEPFVSPVDRTVVTGRRSLAEHNARNGVVNFHEFDGHFEAQAKKRKAILNNTDKEAKADRTADVVKAYKKHTKRD
jgi:hypothetical protein